VVPLWEVRHKIKMAYYKLYCDKVVDLNSGSRLTILETADGTECINGLTQVSLCRESFTDTQVPALRHSALSAQRSGLSSQHSELDTRCKALSAQRSALKA